MPGDGSFGVSGGINKGAQPELIEGAVNIQRGVTAGFLPECQCAGGPCRFQRDAPQYGNDRRAGALPQEEGGIALGS